MAFVYRSTSRNKFLDMNPIPLGPGEYDPEISKTEGRLIHQKNMKYTKVLKKSQSPQIIPFNSTSQRSPIMKYDYYMPGPGTYTLFNKSINKNKNNFSSLSAEKEKEIADIFYNNTPYSEFKGFLSSEKRFSTDIKNISDEYVSPGPGSYNLILHYNSNNNKIENKFLKEKYAPHKGKIYTLPGNLEQKITSIPDKTKGKFKIIKGILTEIKSNQNEKELKKNLGPGKYNIYPKWETTSVMWSKGLKKEEKSKINESKIQKELEQNSTMFNTENYSEKMHNFNTSTVSSTFNNNNSKSKNMSSQLTKTMNINTSNNKVKNISNINGWNTATNLGYKNNSQLNQLSPKPQVEGLIRNKIFHNFFQNKQKHHSETLSKQNYKNNLILDIEYPIPPGPGFYDQKIISKHKNFAYTAQNFGSNSPKFKEIKTETNILGPGTYFKEKNKYEPKIKTVLHIKLPEKINTKKEKSVYIENIINKNKEKKLGPGEYNIKTEYIKKEISNNKSFGSSVERFHEKEITPNKKSKKDTNIKHNNNDVKNYINQSKLEENIKSLNLNKKIKNLIKLEKIKKKEKLHRAPYIYKPIPCVGTYSPEITKSIYYEVFSKLNPYRNTVAPFNMINTRFSQIKNPRLGKKETPGPADYEVLPAFKALNLDKRKYNIFGQNEQRESIIKNAKVPGPGLYNLNKPNEWNIKSYNVLFINK